MDGTNTTIETTSGPIDDTTVMEWINCIFRDLKSASVRDPSSEFTRKEATDLNPTWGADLLQNQPHVPTSLVYVSPIDSSFHTKETAIERCSKYITSMSAIEEEGVSETIEEEGVSEKKNRDKEDLHLLTLLLRCAKAISAVDNLEEADEMLLEITGLSTPFGSSMQRVAAYFSEAMMARLVNSLLGIYEALPPSPPYGQRIFSAFQVFNGISPFVKFSHFTANQAIQEAFKCEERVHILDLDIMQGLQWPGLFYILASRPGGPPHVRLTGLGGSMEELVATGSRLSEFAGMLGLPFKFFPMVEKVGDLVPERLKISKEEAVAVHWLHHSLYDVTGSDSSALWLLQR